MVVIRDNSTVRQQEPAAIGPRGRSLRLFSVHIVLTVLMCAPNTPFGPKGAACHCFHNSLRFPKQNCQGVERESLRQSRSLINH